MKDGTSYEPKTELRWKTEIATSTSPPEKGHAILVGSPVKVLDTHRAGLRFPVTFDPKLITIFINIHVSIMQVPSDVAA